MTELLEDYFQYIDPKKPGMYVIKLNVHIPSEGLERLGKSLNDDFNKYCPGSVVLILPPIFESITFFDETVMNENGWFKKEELPPAKTPTDEMEVLTKR